jgi:hypothetical protein
MSRRPLRTHGRRFALGLSLALLAATLAVPALAEDDVVEGKLYTAAASPDACVTQSATNFTVTLTNTSTSPQQLGSANIDIPSTFQDLKVGKLTLDPAPRLKRNDPKPTVDLVGNQLQLRNLSAGPGVAMSVAFSATPSSGGTQAFVTAAKQANDFKGTGNDLTLVGNDPVVTVGSCSLVFLTQPGDAAVNTAIPGAGGAAAPQVQIVDGTTPVKRSGVDVAITIESNPGSAKLSGTLSMETDTDGVATFGNLKIDTAGEGYTLHASASSLNHTVSEEFRVFEQGTTCTGECKQTFDSGDGLKTTATGTAVAGETGALFGSSTTKKSLGDYTCGTTEYDPVAFSYIPSVVTVVGVNLLNKKIVFQVDRATDQLQVNNGVSFYQICAEPIAPFTQFSTFTDIFGNTVVNPEDTVNVAKLQAAGIKIEDTQASGFLPSCQTGDDAPCVESRVKRGGSPIITVRWGSGFVKR